MNISRLRVLITGDNSGALRAIRETEMAEKGYIRDSQGRWRDAKGKFVRSGYENGIGYSQGFRRGIGNLDKTLRGALGGALGAGGGFGKGLLIGGGVAAGLGAVAGLTGGVAALAGGLAAVAGGFAVAGAGAGAFFALAMPTLTKVSDAYGNLKKAQEDLRAAEFAGDQEAINKALKDQAAALAGLTPAQRTMVDGFMSLRQQWQATATMMEGVTARVVTSFQGLLTNMIPAFSGLAMVGGAAIADVLDDMRGELQTGLFRDMVGTMTEMARPVIRQFGQIAILGMRSFASGLIQSRPLIEQVMGHMVSGMGKLSNFFASEGFAEFIAWVQQALPPVLTLLGAMGGVIITMLQAIAPLVAPIAELMTNLLNTLKPGLDALVTGLGAFLVAAGPGLTTLFQGLSDVLVAIAPHMGALGTAFGEVLAALTPGLVALIAAFADRLTIMAESGVLTRIAVALSDILIALAPLIAPLTELVTELLLHFADYIQTLIDSGALDALVASLIDLAEAGLELTRALGPMIPAMAKIAEMNFRVIAFGISSIAWSVGALADSIERLFKGDTANRLKGLMEVLVLPLSLAGRAGKSLGLPHFATGVNNFSGGLAVVGERGPELVNLPRGSDVIPNHRIGAVGGSASTVIQNTFHIAGENAREIAQEVMNLLEKQQKAANVNVGMVNL